MKVFIKTVLMISVVSTVLVLAAAGIAYNLNRVPPDGTDVDHVFTVEKGEALNSIALRLEEDSLIRSQLFMRVLSKLKGTEGHFQAGSYLIEKDATSLAVHDILVSGQEILTKVTIPEGLSLSRLADILEREGIVLKQDFLTACSDRQVLERYNITTKNAEGFLFPDTYYFAVGYPALKVVEKMIVRFYEVLGDVAPDYKSLGSDELIEKVIIASIIEREYVVPAEAPLMASVFYNRLEKGMRLQSCATVAYVLTEEFGREYPERLTMQDLDADSPYNTYLHGGLPPGPISNPGATALSAVFNAAETDYLYFLLKDQENGNHEFTNTYAEHINAKNLFLKQK